MDKHEVLKRQILFESLNDEEISRIGNILENVFFKKGDYIFREGEDAKGVFLIVSGKVEISKLTSDGWKQTLLVLSNGNFFGELSIIERRLHEAKATALEDTELLLLKKEDFERIESEDIMLALKILKKLVFVLSKNLRKMNEMFLNVLVSY